MKKIVVLTGNSLLAHGLVSRMRQNTRLVELHVVDIQSPDYLQQIFQHQPQFIIFDESDFRHSPHCSLVELLNFMPDVIMLELRVDSSTVQVIQSAQFTATSADELVQMLRAEGGFPGQAMNQSDKGTL